MGLRELREKGYLYIRIESKNRRSIMPTAAPFNRDNNKLATIYIYITMADNEIKIKITADGSSLDAACSKAFNSLRSLADASAKIISAWYSVKKAFEYIDLAAKALQAEESFRMTAASFNINADDMAQKMREVSEGMLDDSSLMQKAVQGMMLGLDECSPHTRG